MDVPLHPDRTVQKDLGIAEYTDPEHNPIIPHTIVLKPGLVIYRIYNPTGSGSVLPSSTCGTTCGT
jgi:hypothetical protein